MCIEVDKKVKPVTTGYKVMLTSYGKLYPLIMGNAEIPLGTWVNEKNHRADRTVAYCNNSISKVLQYSTGWHAYHRLADARDLYNHSTRKHPALVKVKLRDATAAGYQTTSKGRVRITVAKEMYISEVLRTNSKRLKRRTGCA